MASSPRCARESGEGGNGCIGAARDQANAREAGAGVNCTDEDRRAGGERELQMSLVQVVHPLSSGDSGLSAFQGPIQGYLFRPLLGMLVRWQEIGVSAGAGPIVNCDGEP
jgi:hypothetical protein